MQKTMIFIGFLWSLHVVLKEYGHSLASVAQVLCFFSMNLVRTRLNAASTFIFDISLASYVKCNTAVARLNMTQTVGED